MNSHFMKEIRLFEFRDSVHGPQMEGVGCDAMEFWQCLPEIVKHPIYRESFCVLILVESGSAKVKINGIESVATPKTILCGLPSEIWYWEKIPDIEGKVVVFNPYFLLSHSKFDVLLHNHRFLDKDRHNPFISLSDKGYVWIRGIIDEMARQIESRDVDINLLRAQLTLLLALIEKDYAGNPCNISNDEKPRNITVEFMDLVRVNLYEHHDVEFYANKLCVTPNYLNKIARTTLAMSTLEYIHSRVVNEAKSLLELTDMNVTEISQALGFDTANYFARFFKKKTSFTPLEYRNIQKD